MSRNQREGLRKAIVDASIAIGSELGEDGLTMRGIAGRLGVSATALYQHFESKAAILREIRLYCSSLLQSEVFDTSAHIEGPRERIEMMAHKYIVFARTHPWLYSVLTETRGVEWHDMSKEDVDRIVQPLTTFRGWIAEGVEHGVWRKGVDPDMESIRLWAALHGLCSMMNSGRIDENHPAFPVVDQQDFITRFVKSVVGTLVY